MSSTVCVHPIVAALLAAEEIIGKDRVWQPKNEMQEQFLQEFFDCMRGEIGAIPEIETIASWDVEDINRFLRERGFNIELEQLDPDTFAVAATLILLLEWLAEGTKLQIWAKDGNQYEGVQLGKGVAYHTSKHHANPIAEVSTKGGDRVFMTALDTAPTGLFDLVAYAEKLLASIEPNWDWGELIVPMVSVDQLVDISWLLEMETTADTGQRAWISQAKQQTIFKMNERGALLKSAAGMAITLELSTMPKPNLIIDLPFLVCVVRPGLTKPLLVAYIDYGDWKNPGELSK